jgi:hypothetical protein
MHLINQASLFDYVMENCASELVETLLRSRNRQGKLPIECATNEELSSTMSAWDVLLDPSLMLRLSQSSQSSAVELY